LPEVLEPPVGVEAGGVVDLLSQAGTTVQIARTINMRTQMVFMVSSVV
jgi:hypothetical protein